jgi:hypothetical protein
MEKKFGSIKKPAPRKQPGKNEGLATRAKMKLKENFILIPSSLSFHFLIHS